MKRLSKSNYFLPVVVLTLMMGLSATLQAAEPIVPRGAKLEKIFDRFYTDRPVGAKFGLNSGLGLSIVRQIIDTHRGTVTAENRSDRSGARFTVRLPAAV